MIDIPIITERLTIRRFEHSDIDGYLEFMLDDESTRFLAFDAEQKTEVGARALFEYVIGSYDSPEAIHAYCISDSQTASYLGSCGFAPYEEGVVECYYCVNPGQRGSGIAAEATKELIAALSPNFEIRAFCHPDNRAAHAVAERSGMTHVGLSRNKNTGLEGEVFVFPKKHTKLSVPPGPSSLILQSFRQILFKLFV